MDAGDEITYSYLHLPEWLNFTTSSTDALIYGTPTYEHLGSNLVILEVSDGHDEVLQAFTIVVSFPDPVEDLDASGLRVYPNPASEILHFELNSVGFTSLSIYSSDGTEVLNGDVENESLVEMDISHLESGIYLFRLIGNGKTSYGKFIKR